MSDPLMDIPEPARAEVITLLQVLLPAAKQLFETNQKVLPFGAVLQADGKPQMQLTGLLEDEEQTPAQSRDVLRLGMRRRAVDGSVRAAGIAYDTNTLDPEADVAVDAVCVSVEHVDGHSLDAFIPLKKGWFGYRYNPSFLLDAPLRIFGAGEALPSSSSSDPE
jgi:hypothetical protein